MNTTTSPINFCRSSNESPPKASRILELSDRPRDDRMRGMANLATLTDSDLDVLLHDIEAEYKGYSGRTLRVAEAGRPPRA
jgi:hypothetical protein